jgi:hypothetical protein
MRPIACAIALLLLNSAIFGQRDTSPETAQGSELQSGYCPPTHDLEVEPQEKHWFEGSIGNSSVRMYLNRGGSGVVGLFYATRGDWTPTYLGGEWKGGTMSLLAESSDQSIKGHLQGRLVNAAFIGSWTSGGSDHAVPVRLAAAKQPACDGRGTWKRYDNPTWPVSFSYPASWRIKKAPADFKNIDNELELVCPDPESMAYANNLTIYEGERGAGKPIGVSELVRCA